jgi:hypothetical protein
MKTIERAEATESLSWFRHPEMQGRIRKAEADVVAGRTKATRSPAEAQALLDSFKARRRRSRG